MTDVTIVFAGGSGMGRALADRLSDGGERVVVIDGDAIDITDAAVVQGALEVVLQGDRATRMVWAWLDERAHVAAPITAIDEEAWDAAAERSIRAAFVAWQQSFHVLADGARVVLVIPSVAAVGVVDLVPLCTAVEAIRVMGKAVARRWGARSITVNSIEVELSAWLLGGDEPGAIVVPSVPVLGQPALAPASAVDDVVGLVDLLSGEGSGAITGALLVADRGTVMQP